VKSDLSGKTIEKYRLTRKIGEGGMGLVYEAQHSLVGKRCAVKVLHPSLSQDKEAVRRMLREAQAAAAIGHPNIVVTHDFGVTPDGDYYLVMDYLEGESLADLILRSGPLPGLAAVLIMRQVLSALEAAHAKGIVHRDLKPENIFIARTPGGAEEVKLLDFGVSKLVGSEDLRLTLTGAVMGTPYYMSPEQASGSKDVDARSDLWAAGVVLYEVLTRRHPFTGANYNELMYKILTTEPRPARDLRPDISGAMEEVIHRALAKKRDARYATATEMLADLGSTPAAVLLATTAPPVNPNVSLLDLAASGPGVPSAVDDVVPRKRAEGGSLTLAPGETAGWTRYAQKLPTRTWLAAIAGGVLVLAVGVLALVAYKRADTADEAARRAKHTEDATMKAPSAAVVAHPLPPRARPSRPGPLRPMFVTPVGPVLPTLSVAVAGLPRGASVTLDDGPKTKPPLLLEADGLEHKLVVTAPGYRQNTTTFMANKGLTRLVVKLVPLPSRLPGRRGVRTGRRHPRRAGAMSTRSRPRSRPRTHRSGVYGDPYGVP